MGDTEEKFLFDIHSFDDPQDHENDEPEEPSYSQEELDASIKKAYEDGVKKGQDDVHQSLEKQVSETLGAISADVQKMFLAEGARETLFEQEALHLTLHIFQTLYPHFKETLGFKDLEDFIRKTIDGRKIKSTINVYVSDMVANQITDRLESIPLNCEGQFKVQTDPQLSEHACRLSWEDGGAQYDPKGLAQEIEEILKQTLAKNGFTRHDEECAQDQADEHVAREDSQDTEILPVDTDPQSESANDESDKNNNGET